MCKHASQINTSLTTLPSPAAVVAGKAVVAGDLVVTGVTVVAEQHKPLYRIVLHTILHMAMVHNIYMKRLAQEGTTRF